MVRTITSLVLGMSLSLLLAPLVQVAAVAQQSQPAQSPPEAINVYSDAASFQNNGAFELAVEEWQKFLERFPNDPLAPKARHYLGVCLLQLQPPKFEEAAEAFQHVVANHPQFDLLQDTLLNLGWSQYSLAQQGEEARYAEAAATFRRLADDFPEGNYRDQALYYYAEAQYSQGNKNEAVEGYQQLIGDDALADSPLRCDALYGLGVTHEELEQYAQAGAVYDQFLSACQDHELVTEVRMRKAETVLQGEQYAEAAEMFAAAAEVEGFAFADHARLRQAFAMAQQQQFAEAGTIYARIPRDFPDSIYLHEASLAAAKSFYRAEDFESAAHWFGNVLDAGQANLEAAHWLSRIHLREGDAEKAAELAAEWMERGEEGDPQVIDLQMNLADALYEIPERRGEALSIYLEIARQAADHQQAPQALYNAAFTALELKEFAPATRLVTRFQEQFPDHALLPDAQYVAAEALLQQRQYADAEREFAQLIEAHADHASHGEWIVRLAFSQYLQSSYADVVATLSPHLEQFEGERKAEAMFLIGASQFHEGRLDEAGTALQASLDTASAWSRADETMLYLARTQRRQQKLDEAVATIEQLIETFPDSRLLDRAYFRYGEFAYAQQDYSTAAEKYAAVAQSWPNSPYAPYALYGKGWSLLRAQQYAEASAALDEMVERYPDHSLASEAKFARAMSARQMGRYDQAAGDLREYLESDPEARQRAHASYELGLAHVGLQQWDEAIETFNNLLESHPDYADADNVLYEIAWARKQQGQDDQAVEIFAQLASQYPDSQLAAEAHFHVGERYYADGQYDDAVAAYTAARQKADQAELREKALYKLGWAQFQREKFDQALQAFADQLERHPQGLLATDGLYMKAESLFKMEQYDQALPVYREAQQRIAEVDQVSEEVKVLIALHAGQSAAQLEQWAESLELLQPILENHSGSPYLPEVHYEIGWAQQNLNQYDDAYRSFEEAATGSRGEVGARARFMMGELQFAQKNYAAAIADFQRCMFGYGGENAPAEVQYWQAQAGFEAARCAEVQIRDAQPARRPALISEARRYYRYVIERHGEHELAAHAQQRLEALENL